MIQTKRGLEEPYLRQLVVFLDNKVGELVDILRHFANASIRVHAFNVTDSVDFAVVRFVVDDVDRAREVLGEHRFNVSEREIIGVELPESDNALLEIGRALLAAEINTHYAYPMLTKPGRANVVLIHVDDPTLANHVLSQRYRLLQPGDLFEEDGGWE